MRAIVLTILVNIVSLSFFSVSNASQSACKAISSAPFIIDKEGCYFLSNDIFVGDVSTNGITVVADNVTLDLDGHKIIGQSSSIVTNAGIYGLNVKNLHLKNGKISGFLYGIRVDGEGVSARIFIEKISAVENYFRGIAVIASKASIENNEVKNTGGTAIFPDSFAMCIEVIGRDAVIRGNMIDGVLPVGVGEGIGISLSRNRENSLVERNVIRGGAKKGSSFGIWLSTQNEKTKVLNNRIYGFILPFSVPRLNNKFIAEKIFTAPTVEFYGNKSFSTACGSGNHKSYYQGLSSSNVISDRGGCPLLISELTPQYDRNRNDPWVVFRLAQAEGLGVKEATRVLPSIRKVV